MSPTAIEPIESFTARRYIIPTDILAAAGASKVITSPSPEPVHVTDSVTLTHTSNTAPIPASVDPGYGAAVTVAPAYTAAAQPEVAPVPVDPPQPAQ